MNIHHLQEQPSVLSTFIAELRDVTIQKDALRFRRNIERIGEIMAFEISKTLSFEPAEITTPLGSKKMELCSSELVICSVLRAGLPLHQGFLNYFDKAQNAFVSAFRHHPDGDEKFEIVTEYLATPDLTDKTVLLVDPMLATGRSLVSVLEVLQSKGAPEQIHIASVIAAQEGVDYVAASFPQNTSLWVAAIDRELNNKGYIVPGLGDAGDLAYGTKL